MPAVILCPWPLYRQADRDGLPLAGGKLYTYLAGTSTPHVTYAMPDGSAANTNPVVLDASGYARVYLEQGVTYKLVQRDANDVEQWSVDQVGEGLSGGALPPLTSPPGPTGPAIIFAGAIPAGRRVRGVTSRILQDIGTSQGLTGFVIGGMGVEDGWGLQTVLSAGATTGLADFRRGDEPVSQVAEDIILLAVGGAFDGTGSVEVTIYTEEL